MPAGIVEKGNSGLFENEIEFTGEYASMVRYLKEIGLFLTLREAYVLSSIVGFVNDRQEKNSKTEEKVQPASVFPNELTKRKPDLRFIYRLIMLLKEEPGFTLDDYKNRTFRDDPEENLSEMRENMIIFNSYACGGLEYLYERFSDCNRIEDTVDTLYDLLHRFAIDVGLSDDENELPDFEPDFS